MKQSPSRVDVPLQLWVVLARAFDAVERHSRASIARFELGTTEFGVLEVLYHKGELPVCDVQRRILVESSSTTYVVDKLVKRGLVRRRHSGSDRRVRDTVRSIGYNDASFGFDSKTCAVITSIDEQSPDIAQGVDKAKEVRDAPTNIAIRRMRSGCCARWAWARPSGWRRRSPSSYNPCRKRRPSVR